MLLVLHTAKLIVNLMPPLVPHAGITPEHIVRIHGTLDADEAVVVRAPELMLPVRLMGVGLQRKSMVSFLSRFKGMLERAINHPPGMPTSFM